MEKAVIPNIGTSQPQSNVTQTETLPQLSRYSNMTLDDLSSLVRLGRVTQQELEADARAYAIRAKQVVSPKYVVMVLHRLEDSYNSKTVDVNAQARRFKAFADDCVLDGVTFAEFDLGEHLWRRKDTNFMPTYGQFLTLIRPEGKQIARSAYSYSRVVEALFQPAKLETKKTRYVSREEKIREIESDVEENQRLVDRMLSEKRRGKVIRPNGDERDWNGLDDDFLKSANVRLCSSLERLDEMGAA